MIVSSDIARIRLFSQQLAATQFTAPKDIVAWMGAMQAQDFPMARWAIGARQPNVVDAEVISAIDRAELIRTHLLRPTWHFVTPNDIYWLLELTAPQIKNAQKSRDRDLELTEKVYSQSNGLLENALRDGNYLSREELIARLRESNFKTDQNRASHLFMRAELEKIICSGPIRHGKPMYALLPERVREPKKLSREEALITLASRYFTSRCPATLKDFVWWSGLPAREARWAAEQLKSSFHMEEIQGREYCLPSHFSIPEELENCTHLLPSYDEFTLSYIDRGAAFPAQLESYMKLISDRGIFRPILLIDGQVSGVWKRTNKSETVIIELQLFIGEDEADKGVIDDAASRYGSFVNKSVDIKYIPHAPTKFSNSMRS